MHVENTRRVRRSTEILAEDINENTMSANEDRSLDVHG